MKHPRFLFKRFVAAALFPAALLAANSFAQRYSFRIYGQQDGLKNLNVVCILQSRDGYLWLGTDNGLFRYDGARFIEYNASAGLTNPYVSALAEDSSGNLWAGTASGLFFLRGESFQELRFQGQSLSIGLDSALASLPDDRLLAVSRSRLFEIVPQTGEQNHWAARPLAGTGAFRQLSAAENIVSVYADRESRIWFGCSNALCSVAGGKLTRWGVGQGVPKSNWVALFEDRNGTLWARSTRNIITLGNDKTQFKARSTGQEAQLANNHYVSFGETRTGEIITPGAEGIALWTGDRWKSYPVAQGLNTYPVESIYVDPRGLIWTGIEGHGLCSWLRYSTWESWTTADGLESPITWGIVLDNNGRIWVAEDKGISVSDPGRTHFTSALGKLSTESMLGVAKDPTGHIWSVSGTGVLWKFDPTTLRPKRIAKTTDANSLYADRSGNIWISTEDGLYVCNASDCSPHKTGLAALDSGNVYRVVAAPDGTLWAAGDYGLFYNSDGKWRSAASNLPGPEAGLIEQVTDMDFGADGSLWIVNGFSRVARLKVVNGCILSAQILGPAEISSTSTLFLRGDHRGYIWAGHDRGVDVFDGHSWHTITANQGLLWNDTDANAFDAADDDTVWIGTSEGISHFTGAQFQPTPKLPAPQISRISYGGDPLPAERKFTWRQATLELLFSPFAYQQEDQIGYEYRLDGVDHGWQRSDSPEARYSSLVPPGNYTFWLRTVNEASNTVSPVVSVQFTILPQWWQTDWFQLLCTIALISLAVVVWKFQVRHLLARQKELKALVAERTRELKEQATHDALTGLWNRRAILEVMNRELGRARREKCSVTITLVDIDHFKQVNDRMGHVVGDIVLRETGQRFRDAIRSYDAAGRYGGEEFLIILPNVSRDAILPRLLELQAALTKDPVPAKEHQIVITCSLGAVTLDGQQNGNQPWSEQEALSAADTALYLAKRNGRNRIEFFCEQQSSPKTDG